MHSRQLNMFLSNKLNLKTMATIPKTEQLHCCFPKYAKNIKSLKFVPRNYAPKIPVMSYHDPDKQAIVAQRLYSLHYETKKPGKSAKYLTNRLQHMLNAGYSMSYSTKVLREDIKGAPVSSGLSSSSENFDAKSTSLLTKYLFQPQINQRRFKSTYQASLSPSKSKTSLLPEQVQNASRKQSLVFIERARREERAKRRSKENVKRNEESNAADSLELAFNIRNKLEDLSTRIKDDLVAIDGTLKAKIDTMKNRFGGSMLTARSKSFIQSKRPYHTSFELMPMKQKMSSLEIVAEHTKRMSLDPKRGRRHYKDDQTYFGNDGREIRRNQQPFEIKTQLMEVRPNKKRPKERTYGAAEPIIGITTKDAADADGVYYAKKTRHYV